MENQPETKPDYFIQIPSRVLFETKLSAAAKLFYGEVLLLSHTNGFCSNDNHYFIKNHDVTDKTIQNWINELKSLKLIKIEYIRNHSYKVDIRKIFPLVKIDSTIISHKGPNDTLIFKFEPKPKSNPINKQVFGEHQNIFLLEKEITELKRKYSDEIIEQAFDEIGRSLKTEKETELLSYILRKRYDNQLPTIIISNMEKKMLLKKLGDAVVDRLKEIGFSIEFIGESYRVQKRKEMNNVA